MNSHLVQGLVVLAFCFSACQSQISIGDKDLKGKWVVKKAKRYADGKEVVYFPMRADGKSEEAGAHDSDMEAICGISVDPALVEFTKYGEVIIGVQSAIEYDRESAVYSYKFRADTLHLVQNMFPENKNPVYVYKAGSDTLVMVYTRVDGESNNKKVLTTYCTR